MGGRLMKHGTRTAPYGSPCRGEVVAFNLAGTCINDGLQRRGAWRCDLPAFFGPVVTENGTRRTVRSSRLFVRSARPGIVGERPGQRRPDVSACRLRPSSGRGSNAVGPRCSVVAT